MSAYKRKVVIRPTLLEMPKQKTKRHLSKKAIQNIKNAQKKRWAKFHKEQKNKKTPTKKNSKPIIPEYVQPVHHSDDVEATFSSANNDLQRQNDSYKNILRNHQLVFEILQNSLALVKTT